MERKQDSGCRRPADTHGGRLRRELETVRAMVEMHCRRHHPGPALCDACAELWEYARSRVAACPFCPDKPTCAQCPVHCYKPAQRERIRQVMRWAGPRMLWRHPWLALMHLWDGHRMRKRAEALAKRPPKQ